MIPGVLIFTIVGPGETILPEGEPETLVAAQ